MADKLPDGDKTQTSWNWGTTRGWSANTKYLCVPQRRAATPSLQRSPTRARLLQRSSVFLPPKNRKAEKSIPLSHPSFLNRARMHFAQYARCVFRPQLRRNAHETKQARTLRKKEWKNLVCECRIFDTWKAAWRELALGWDQFLSKRIPIKSKHFRQN